MKEKFRNLKSFTGIADILEIPEKLLWEILMGKKKKGYFKFEINKKNGNKRIIESPNKNLAILQKKLNHILKVCYKNHHTSSHGFILNRSIKTNAIMHLDKNVIFNIDIENFFGSIGFPRIRGLFLSYFKLNNSVASTLANICCNNNDVLPQGAATSPIIANMICRRLDQELDNLARRNRCVYTRYADDITFSTNESFMPSFIAEKMDLLFIAGKRLSMLVEKNGFFINKDKTRLSYSNKSQIVTGIKVNEKLNVQRKYIRRIRSILHFIEKNNDDLKKCEDVFSEKYSFRRRRENQGKMFSILRGMIGYVGQVKGREDAVFQSLAERYNKIIESFKAEIDEPFIRVPLNSKRLNELNCFVIEALIIECSLDGDSYESQTEQGTGFLLKNIGFITNAHVLSILIRDLEEEGFSFKYEFPIKIHNSIHNNKSYYAKIKYYDFFLDIAILEVKDLDVSKYGFHLNESISESQFVKVLGYPSYMLDHSLSTEKGKIKNEVQHTGSAKKQSRFRTSAMIYGGNSGGPVLNSDNEVIGIATKGLAGGSKGISPNEIIPIQSAIEVNELQVTSSKNH